MNLYEKIKDYFWSRKKGFSHRFSWNVFKQPLTDVDYIAISLSIFTIVCASAWAINEAQAGQLRVKTAQASHMYQLAQQNALKAQKNELVIVSFLNGSLKIDGKVKTFGMMNAAGVCNAP